MTLKPKTILLISPEKWGQNRVSKHHYAIQLAKDGYLVYFLNPPSSQEQVSIIAKNLIVLDYKVQIRGLGKLPSIIAAHLIKREIKRLEKLASKTFDIIWNFDSSRFFNLTKIKDKLRICHIVDMSENFYRNMLAQSSDICLCTSNYILEEMIPFNSNVHKIHHGYQIPTNRDNEISHIKTEGKINVGYVGNLSSPYINWNLILELINNHEEIHFHFIGPYSASNLSGQKSLDESVINLLKKKINVHLHGGVDSELIPSFLQKFDIQLSAYKIESEADIKQLSNVHKTMEYIGSGKITISTYCDEYKDKPGLIEMAKDPDDFKRLFDLVINNLESYNSAEAQEKRIKFSNDHSYKNQCKKVMALLKEVQ